MNKIFGFFEEHIEKIVLGIAGILCLLLLTFRVLISPNYVKYDGKKFRAGKIDVYISGQAEVLSDKLNQPPQQPEPYIPRAGEFTALFESAISDIDVSVSPPIPAFIQRDIRMANRAYRVPRVGEVNDVAVEYIGAVAYVPTVEINEQTAYDQAGNVPDDIDFVTVEAKFDIAGLYERLYESFAGIGVREEWRDPCLAKPVFGAVQLQRQELLEDGSWGDWQIVPRTKIDASRRMFEVTEDVAKLPPGGIKVRMIQFDKPEVQIDLLQPEAYRIASANEEWFPPSLHKKFLEQRRVEESETRREAMEQAKQEQEREREAKMEERRNKRPDTRRSSEVGGGYSESGSEGGFGGSRYTRTRRDLSTRSDRRPDKNRLTRTRQRDDRESDVVRPGASKETSKKSTINDIYKEFSEISITPKTDIAKMREPLAFWAHDDTVEPKKSYRYRIRIGIFNSIAGTGQFSEQDRRWENNVILWSEFSDVTDTVDIPGRLYFFASDLQEAAKTVTVDVCKYVLGYWYSERFAVKQGEVIGKVKNVELKPEEKEKRVTVPEKIDYGTEAVLVDIVPVNDWSGSGKLTARGYYDMLYSFDGMNIEHMPVKAMYWAKELQATFAQIQKLQKQPKEPLRDWSSRVGGRIQRATEVEYKESDYTEEDY